MAYEVEFTDEFEVWWNGLTEAEQVSINEVVIVLMEKGPALGRPYADTLSGSKFPNMKELRVQHHGRPYRIPFAFDPRRVALLLLGGDKTGNSRWTAEAIARADTLYAAHLAQLEG
ncbi:MAG TPA: type II toxin-antitoxin system RelE/ParE family toxin [Acidobacteriaceae bacterium]|nr:type II toxin-antitoxin system RelE/ParE family toxin [Acidobacteriaceae bacterium]